MPENFTFGYCTNVHAGVDLDSAKLSLLRYASSVREHLRCSDSLPLGLWLSDTTSEQLAAPAETRQFKHWLSENHFSAYTLNGFPQRDFHEPVVKHAVYEPTWCTPERRDYTLRLADILSQLIAGDLGTISTLPLGWPHQPWSDDDLAAAGKNLRQVAMRLAELREETGKEIVLAIEPEPGCVLNTAPEIVDFFERYLFVGEEQAAAQRHLSVCHDICHSSVMFEEQEFALQQYLDNGIRIGKVQVSAAVHVPWNELDSTEQTTAAWQQLSEFNEPKYLHQTTRARDDGKLDSMQEDLPDALKQWQPPEPGSPPWRVHFHVPIFVKQFELLRTTQEDIQKVIRFLDSHRTSQVGPANWFTGHYEVETYAWPVLPKSLAVDDLATGIAREMTFLRDLAQK
ncbi:MAG: metabolite traffic protein EboE [Pirellulaceae bacterium]